MLRASHGVRPAAACWCGESSLDTYSDEYATCSSCGTLISTNRAPELAEPGANAARFYGRAYWFAHQEDKLDQPNILERARLDLPERCLHWLRAVLKYRLPPGKVLELGSAHGGFVAMLGWAGFESIGLELDEWVADFAHETFDVSILHGRVEQQALEPASLDAIVLMDVLEHFNDPLETMRACGRLLRADGIFVVQTPRVPSEKSFAELSSTGDRFLEQLKADEHLFLFSQASIDRLFRLLGFEYLYFEPAIFAHYDMFLVASRHALVPNHEGAVVTSLSSTPHGRMVLSLLDMESGLRDARRARSELDSDTSNLLKEAQRLSAALAEAEADRAARLHRIQELEARLVQSEADRAARLDRIDELEARLVESDADRAARLERSNELEARLVESDADRAARLERINELEARLVESDADRAARLVQSDADLRALNEHVQVLGAEIEQLERSLLAVEGSIAYRLARRMHLAPDIAAPIHAQRANDEGE